MSSKKVFIVRICVVMMNLIPKANLNILWHKEQQVCFKQENGSIPYHLPLTADCINTVLSDFILDLHCIQSAVLFLVVDLTSFRTLFYESICWIIRKCAVLKDRIWTGYWVWDVFLSELEKFIGLVVIACAWWEDATEGERIFCMINLPLFCKFGIFSYQTAKKQHHTGWPVVAMWGTLQIHPVHGQ